MDREVKVCSQCSQLAEFSVGVHGRICRKCKNLKQKEYRKRNNNHSTKIYEKTKRGYLVRTYRNMLSRVSGVLKSKYHLYEGLSILDKEDFYRWSETDKNFNNLFDVWEKSEYDTKLSPSIDRVNPKEGYSLDNMRWLTHGENSRLGAISRHHGNNSAH